MARFYGVNVYWSKLNAMERHDLIKRLNMSYSDMYLRLANPEMFTRDQLTLIANYFNTVWQNYRPIDQSMLVHSFDEK